MTLLPRPVLRRYHHTQFNVSSFIGARHGITVSVCLPARNEEATVGQIVGIIRTELVERTHLVDEIIDVDDRSTDATAAVATQARALVVPTQCLPESGAGKGAAMATALAVSKLDVIVFLDADVLHFSASFVLGLLGSLFGDRSVAFAKATYRRSLGGVAGEGGRVTELAARPLLDLLFPELAQFDQPLAGECAVRRTMIESLSLAVDYGVDIALLIDVAVSAGFASLAEVDLDHRLHRNRSLRELASQASSVIRAILTRADVNIATRAWPQYANRYFEERAVE